MIALAGLIVLAAGLFGAGIAVWLEPPAQRRPGSRAAIAIEVGIAWAGVVALICLVSVPLGLDVFEVLPLLVPAVVIGAALCGVRSARHATSLRYGPVLFALPSFAFGLLQVNAALAHIEHGAYFPWFMYGPVLFGIALLGHVLGLRRRRVRMVAS